MGCKEVALRLHATFWSALLTPGGVLGYKCVYQKLGHSEYPISTFLQIKRQNRVVFGAILFIQRVFLSVPPMTWMIVVHLSLYNDYP